MKSPASSKFIGSFIINFGNGGILTNGIYNPLEYLPFTIIKSNKEYEDTFYFTYSVSYSYYNS